MDFLAEVRKSRVSRPFEHVECDDVPISVHDSVPADKIESRIYIPQTVESEKFNILSTSRSKPRADVLVRAFSPFIAMSGTDSRGVVSSDTGLHQDLISKLQELPETPVDRSAQPNFYHIFACAYMPGYDCPAQRIVRENFLKTLSADCKLWQSRPSFAALHDAGLLDLSYELGYIRHCEGAFAAINFLGDYACWFGSQTPPFTKYHLCTSRNHGSFILSWTGDATVVEARLLIKDLLWRSASDVGAVFSVDFAHFGFHSVMAQLILEWHDWSTDCSHCTAIYDFSCDRRDGLMSVAASNLVRPQLPYNRLLASLRRQAIAIVRHVAGCLFKTGDDFFDHVKRYRLALFTNHDCTTGSEVQGLESLAFHSDYHLMGLRYLFAAWYVCFHQGVGNEEMLSALEPVRFHSRVEHSRRASEADTDYVIQDIIARAELSDFEKFKELLEYGCNVEWAVRPAMEATTPCLVSASDLAEMVTGVGDNPILPSTPELSTPRPKRNSRRRTQYHDDSKHGPTYSPSDPDFSSPRPQRRGRGRGGGRGRGRGHRGGSRGRPRRNQGRNSYSPDSQY
jgi:hypothetical protein